MDRGLLPEQDSIGELNLIPQRSAPPPPGSAPLKAARGQSTVGGGSGFIRPGASSSTSYGTTTSSSASTIMNPSHRSSYVAGSYRQQAGTLGASASTLPSRPALPHQNSTSGLPSAHSTLPHHPASSPPPPLTSFSPASMHAGAQTAAAPPRPSRANTTGLDNYPSFAASTAPEFSAGAARSHSSVGPSNRRTNHASPASPAPDSFGNAAQGQTDYGAYEPSPASTAASQIVSSGRDRERLREGGASALGGRNTFKSVFGGFVNSMSGAYPASEGAVMQE